jgi:NTE family protein
MQNTISRLKLAAYSPDVIIDIPKNACGSFEFYRAKELIALGRRKAEKTLTGMRGLDSAHPEMANSPISGWTLDRNA